VVDPPARAARSALTNQTEDEGPMIMFIVYNTVKKFGDLITRKIALTMPRFTKNLAP
jgi:hypothetical protein